MKKVYTGEGNYYEIVKDYRGEDCFLEISFFRYWWLKIFRNAK